MPRILDLNDFMHASGLYMYAALEQNIYLTGCTQRHKRCKLVLVVILKRFFQEKILTDHVDNVKEDVKVSYLTHLLE